MVASRAVTLKRQVTSATIAAAVMMTRTFFQKAFKACN